MEPESPQSISGPTTLMTWVRIDDGFATHPKVVEAGPMAMALDIAAMCYCATHLTDGFIPITAVKTLGNFPHGQGLEKIVTSLISTGLWEVTPEKNGYLVHDYLEYNPSKLQIKNEREANAKRQSRYKRNKSNGVTPLVTGEVTAPVTEIKQRPVPGPSPAPSPGTYRDIYISSNGESPEDSDGTLGGDSSADYEQSRLQAEVDERAELRKQRRRDRRVPDV